MFNRMFGGPKKATGQVSGKATVVTVDAIQKLGEVSGRAAGLPSPPAGLLPPPAGQAVCCKRSGLGFAEWVSALPPSQLPRPAPD